MLCCIPCHLWNGEHKALTFPSAWWTVLILEINGWLPPAFWWSKQVVKLNPVYCAANAVPHLSPTTITTKSLSQFRSWRQPGICWTSTSRSNFYPAQWLMLFVICFPSPTTSKPLFVSAQAKKWQNKSNDNNQTNDVNNSVHDFWLYLKEWSIDV